MATCSPIDKQDDEPLGARDNNTSGLIPWDSQAGLPVQISELHHYLEQCFNKLSSSITRQNSSLMFQIQQSIVSVEGSIARIVKELGALSQDSVDMHKRLSQLTNNQTDNVNRLEILEAELDRINMYSKKNNLKFVGILESESDFCSRHNCWAIE